MESSPLKNTKEDKKEPLKLKFLREIYHKKVNYGYTDEQLLELRKFTNTMAEIAVDCYKRMKQEGAVLDKE